MQKKVTCLRERIASSRSGQGGMNAAILVAIIAGLIILYIVFLPSAEREKVVGETKTAASSEENPDLLLKEIPGMLSTSAGLEAEKSIPTIFLVETTNAKELEKINPFIATNGWLNKKTRSIDFGIEDPANTDNVLLSFTAKKRTGVLAIKLNNEVVFESELASDIIEPIGLEKRLLGKKNTLEFSVSSVGMRFWATNEYSFDNVKIIGDITDTSRQESTNLFTISDSEFSSIDKATLKFIPYCGSVNEVGALDIFVNNKKLFSSVPKCSDAYRQSIPKSALNEGENNVVFKTSRGSYSVEQINVALEFREPSVKTYYFEIGSSEFRKITNGDKDAVLTLKFVDGKSKKALRLNVNGRMSAIGTEKQSISQVINSQVSEGSNYVRLEPIDDVEVAELSVELV